MDYREEFRQLERGDVLVVYTDGLVEARDAQRRQYGLERLKERAVGCRRSTSQQIRDRLLEDLSEHCGGKQPQDDVTLVVVRA